MLWYKAWVSRPLDSGSEARQLPWYITKEEWIIVRLVGFLDGGVVTYHRA